MLPYGMSLLLARRAQREGSAVLLALTSSSLLTLAATNGLWPHPVGNIALAVVAVMSSIVTRKWLLVALVGVALGCIAWLVGGEPWWAFTPRAWMRSLPGEFFPASLIVLVTAAVPCVLSWTFRAGSL